MTEAIIVAAIAATPGVLGAVLGYLNNRSPRQQTGTAAAVPLGRLLEQLDRKVDRLAEGIVDLRQRVARLADLDRYLEARREGPERPTGGLLQRQCARPPTAREVRLRPCHSPPR